jgi:hypothetical protein
MRVELSAVIVAVNGDDPQALVSAGKPAGDALPSGPLRRGHRTLELGLRSWIEEHTRQPVGYVEQLYTFGDLDRQPDARVLSIGYLALVPGASTVSWREGCWRSWYGYFPWEDRRGGVPAVLTRIRQHCRRWIASAGRAERLEREERVRANFGLAQEPWNEERVLERYELLYEMGLVPESRKDRTSVAGLGGAGMIADHRRILATAMGRVRGKIKYRPVVFELLPPTFTLARLQQTVEALSGVRLHTSNFRRLVASQQLIEETGAVAAGARGRPASLMRFRGEIMRERSTAVAVRLPLARRSS